MRSITPILIASALLAGPLLAQPREFPQYPAARDVTVTAVPDVVAAGAPYKLVWQGDATADGIAGYKGGILFAQEQTNHIGRLDQNGKFSVFLSNPHGPGAVAINSKGQILTVERTCTDPGGHLGVKPADCKEATDVAFLTPERKIIADSVDSKSLGRVNDLVANRKGDIYFTSGGAFHVSPGGTVSSIGENLTRTNGITMSPDEKTLYLTNNATVQAFNVKADGSVGNQREFAKLSGGGDGMAIDSKGRLFVTIPGQFAIEVFSPDGKRLGVIPTPRQPITVTFSGPGKKTLYVGGMGAHGPDGKDIRTAPGVRNTAMTVYTLPTLTQGFKGRAR